MLNYSNLTGDAKQNYDDCAKQIDELPRVSVWDSNEPYVELRRRSYKYRDTVIEILRQHHYYVTRQQEVTGSDYTAYYIWFDQMPTPNNINTTEGQ